MSRHGKIMTVLGGSLPGAVSGALVGAYHYKMTLAYYRNRTGWPGKTFEPIGAAEGAVLGALAGALAFSLLRRRWPRLPLPVLALLSAVGVAFVGLLFSSLDVD